MSKTHAPTPKADLYSRVTDRILAELDAGTRPWVKPWTVAGTAGQISRPRRANGTPYRGINVLLLWGEAVDHGYSSSTWMTYKQAQALGGQVRKGEESA